MNNFNVLQIAETFFISAVVSYLATPFLRSLAVLTGYLDHPKDNKIHAHATPLLGGVAIFVAFLVSVVTKSQISAYSPVSAVLIGSFILLIVGLIDDRVGMGPNLKLLGQFLAAMVVIKSGLRVEFLKNYYLNVIFSYVWIVGITNSFNLLDNMNGLSAGIAAISAIFFGAISYLNGDMNASVISFALAGAALGFLKHNFPKASVFMGDAGSLVLGYVLSSVAIMGSWKSGILTTSLLIPVFILGYPIFDTVLVSVIRLLERRSVFQGGKDHSSHRLALLGFKKVGAVVLIYGICVVFGLTALVISSVHWRLAMAIATLEILAVLGLGIRLGFVTTTKLGRRKNANVEN